MSTLTLKVEPMVGSEFIDTVIDAKRLAIRLDLAYVTFKFNGADVSVSQRADETDLWVQFRGGTRHVIG